MVDRPTVTNDYKIINSSSFDSHGKPILYSGDFNRARMEKFCTQSGHVPMEKTEGGKRLAEPDRYKEYGFAPANHVMSLASSKYVSQARGDLKTFVAGARPERVHRTLEVRIAVKNKAIETVNGVERKRFENIYDRAYQGAISKGMDPRSANLVASDRTYRAFAVTELRQVQREAYRSADKKQIADYQDRKVAHLNQRIEDRMAMAERQGIAYTGPQKKTPEQRALDVKIGTRNMHARASLDKNIREGHVPKQEAPKEKARIEKKLAEYAKTDISASQTREASKSFTKAADSSKASIAAPGASAPRAKTI
jgi:hypothetical protein